MQGGLLSRDFDLSGIPKAIQPRVYRSIVQAVIRSKLLVPMAVPIRIESMSMFVERRKNRRA